MLEDQYNSGAVTVEITHKGFYSKRLAAWEYCQRQLKVSTAAPAPKTVATEAASVVIR